MKNFSRSRWAVFLSLALASSAFAASTSPASRWLPVFDHQTDPKQNEFGSSLLETKDGMFAGGVFRTAGKPLAWTILRTQDGGKTFKTVDSFNGSAQQGAQVLRIAKCPNGDLFAAGDEARKTATQTILARAIRRSIDGGKTWTTVHTYSPQKSWGTTLFAIACDRQNRVMATGPSSETVPNGQDVQNHWVTLRGEARGTTWRETDRFLWDNVTFGESFPMDIAATPKGSWFTVGAAIAPSATRLSWLVRRSTDGGGSWQNVDAFNLDQTNGSTWANSIAVDPDTGLIYTAGVYFESAANPPPSGPRYSGGMAIRVSSDDGATWKTITTVRDRPLFPVWHQGISMVVRHGQLYLAESMTHVDGANAYSDSWGVSRLDLRTGQWTVLDRFQRGPGLNTGPQAIEVDSHGAVWVAGYANRSPGGKYGFENNYFDSGWVIRKAGNSIDGIGMRP